MKHRKRKRHIPRKGVLLLGVSMVLVAASIIALCGFSQPRANIEVEPVIPSPPIELDSVVFEPEPEPAPEPEIEEPKFPYYDHIALEYELQELVWEACEETGCSYELALAVIFRESSYRNVNGDNGNSIGYMQIQPRWHSERMEKLGVDDLSDPLSNFRVGCDLLVELIERYGSVESALTCYNTGNPGTSSYADRVLAYMNETFPIGF